MSGNHSSASRQPHTGYTCGIVPPYLLAQLATVRDPQFQAAAAAARRSLLHDRPMREIREVQQLVSTPSIVTVTPGAPPHSAPHPVSSPQRTISDAEGLEVLPGTRVRSEGEPATPDVGVNEAYDGLGHTFALFLEAFSRASIDEIGRASCRERVF